MMKKRTWHLRTGTLPKEHVDPLRKRHIEDCLRSALNDKKDPVDLKKTLLIENINQETHQHPFEVEGRVQLQTNMTITELEPFVSPICCMMALTKRDLINLVMGYNPTMDLLHDARMLKHGRYYKAACQWNWNYNSLEMASEAELIELHDLLRGLRL